MALLIGLLRSVRLAAIAYSILPTHTLGSLLLCEISLPLELGLKQMSFLNCLRSLMNAAGSSSRGVST